VSPRQVRARVVAATPPGGALGGYAHLVLADPVLAGARPGQFVAVAVGDRQSSMLLRRAFSVHRADPAAGTVEVVVAAHGAGTSWIARRGPGDELDVVGPLGTRFDLPGAGGRLVLVGGGYGAAPFAWTAQAAVASGVHVDAVVGAGDRARLCDVDGIRAVVEPSGGRVLVTTDDGSAGERGRVTDALAPLLAATDGPVTVAACGPMAMLAAVARTGREAVDPGRGRRVRVQVAVEEAMACGIGICMTCVLPVRGADGTTRMLRSCTDGPVLDADRVRWDCVGAHGASVPADAVGAPEGGAA
jgi:dihydroorotate dehydrogenase electron transfer subunit